jgi:endonuclease/exonuclease/phosphatase family metal-dependent hydrolase
MLRIIGTLAARGARAWPSAWSVASLVLLAAVWAGCRDDASPARPDASAPPGDPVDGGAPQLGTPPPNVADRLFVVPALSACDDTAPAPAQLRVMSWNMHSGRTLGLDAVATEIGARDADIVLLQEVDAYTIRSGRVEQAKILAEQLGYEYVFASALPWDGGEYGMAILSRLRFAAIERIWLDVATTSEQRMGLVATLCRGAQEIRAVDHHADVFPEGRLANIRQLMTVLGDSIGAGMVLGTDLNEDPTGPVTGTVFEAGFVDVVEPYDTSGTYGQRRYDHIFADAALAPAAVAGQVIDTPTSDHEIVIVDFAFE